MNTNLLKLKRLKRKIAGLEMTIPGSIRTIYQPCGQANCRCKNGKKHWHGPYYLWGRRINGRLTSKTISKSDLPLYRRWIKNKTKLKTIVAEILDVGCKYATEYDKKDRSTLK